MTYHKIFVTDDNINNININKYKFLEMDIFVNLPDDKIKTYDLLLIRANILPIVKSMGQEWECFLKNNNKNESIEIQIQKCTLPKVLYIHDIHNYSFIGGFEALFNLSKELNINYVISNFSDNLEFNIIYSNFERLNIPVFVYPIFNLAFDDSWIPPINLNKEYDIIYYGADIHYCYAFRLRLKHILEKYHKQYNWRIRIIKYGELTHKDLYNEINKSLLCVCTRSSFDYLLFKYIEIPFSNSLIIGDIPTQLKNYLKHNSIIEINEDMDDSTICKIINDNLKNTDLIFQKIKELQSDLKYLNRKYTNHYLTLIADKILNK